jgi:hypothetical protein
MITTDQIKEVYFERCFNLGNYETFRVGLHATVGPGQTAEEVVNELDKFTVKVRNGRDGKAKEKL